MKKRKLLDLSEKCVDKIGKKATEKGTNFKWLAQEILEKAAKKMK